MGNPSRHFLRLAVGFLICSILVPLIYGLVISSLSDAFATVFIVFAASIVCTMGVSLVIWIPIFWLIGLLVLGIMYAVGLVFVRSPATPPVQRDLMAIIGYIQQSRRHGASDNQITNRLREHGWTDTEIDQAFQSLSNAASSSS